MVGVTKGAKVAVGTGWQWPNPAEVTDDIDTRITEDQKAKVRRIIAGNSVDAIEANEFMKMLGVHPRPTDNYDQLTVGPVEAFAARSPDGGGQIACRR